MEFIKAKEEHLDRNLGDYRNWRKHSLKNLGLDQWQRDTRALRSGKMILQREWLTLQWKEGKDSWSICLSGDPGCLLS